MRLSLQSGEIIFTKQGLSGREICCRNQTAQLRSIARSSTISKLKCHSAQCSAYEVNIPGLTQPRPSSPHRDTKIEIATSEHHIFLSEVLREPLCGGWRCFNLLSVLHKSSVSFKECF